MKVLLCVCLFLIMSVNCQDGLKGIEFLKGMHQEVNIKPDISSLYTNGFTVCLRAMFSYIGLSNIFDAPLSAGLEIDQYWFATGVVQIFEINYHFQWPNKTINLEPYVWYSFCVQYSVQNNLVNLFLNGNITYNETGRNMRKNFHPLFESVYLGQCFPIWGRFSPGGSKHV